MTISVTTAKRQTAGRESSALLRTSLRADGWSTAAFGAFMLAGARWLDGLFGLPAALSVPFGIAMLGGAAALGLIAGYPEIPARLAVAVVVVNALCSVEMLVLAFTDVVPLTGLGRAFLVTGALVVAVFAEFEFVGLRRRRTGSAAAGS